MPCIRYPTVSVSRSYAVALLSLLFVVVDVFAGYSDEDPERYMREVRQDTMEDDDRNALETLRERIKHNTTSAAYGIVLVTGEAEMNHFGHLIVPIWEQYCLQHGMDLFLQQKRLSTLNTLRFEWTKPRLLMELVQHTKWKYFWIVDANSLPLQLNVSWTYAIKQHMRHKRWKDDKTKSRVIWCPKDCDPGGGDHLAEGTCYGPLLSGCIMWKGGKSQKKKLAKILKEWYAKRFRQGQSTEGLLKAFDETKSRNWDEMFYHDVGTEIGRPESTFLATYKYHPDYKWNTRDMLADAIKKHRILGDAANDAQEFKPEL